jgi:hypothetical protein
MNIIYNFWTEPLKKTEGGNHLRGLRLFFHCLSLSVIFNQKLGNLHFYGDKKIIEYIKYLGLPFEQIFTIDDYPFDRDLWSASKFLVMAKQKEPFLLVDYDVFFYKDCISSFFNDGIVAQSLESEKSTPAYKGRVELLREYIPEFFENDFAKNFTTETFVRAYCCGILGGTDLDFFQEFSAEALKLATKISQSKMTPRQKNNFAIIIEQWLLFLMTNYKGKKVSLLLKSSLKNTDFASISDEASQLGFCHLAGATKLTTARILVNQFLLLKNEGLYDKIEEIMQEELK